MTAVITVILEEPYEDVNSSASTGTRYAAGPVGREDLTSLSSSVFLADSSSDMSLDSCTRRQSGFPLTMGARSRSLSHYGEDSQE